MEVNTMSMGLIPFRRSFGSPLASRWEPFRLFDDPGSDLLPGFSAERPAGFTPRVDVTETDESYVLIAELPGMEEKDFEIVLEDGVLTLKGEKRAERDRSAEGWSRTESLHGRFERRFRFPVDLVADEVTAVYRNGLLEVTLPKAPEARPQVRQIPVTSA